VIQSKAKGCSTPAPNLLQFRLLKFALAECNINVEQLDVDVDHRNGVIDVQGVKLGLKYPRIYLKHIENLNHEKLYDFCFIGHFESFGRKESLAPFIEKNSYIKHSEVGRQQKKYSFDTNYYQTICNSKFGLVPNHTDPKRPKKWQHSNAWSYRFVETIISGAIPVLFHESPLGKDWVDGFKYLWNDSNFKIGELQYNDIIQHNKTLSLKRFFITDDEVAQIQNRL